MARRAMILYVPVVHDGYLKVIEDALKEKSIDIYVLNDEIVSQYQERSEIRAIPVAKVVEALRLYFGDDFINLLDNRAIPTVRRMYDTFILTNDDVVRRFAEDCLEGKEIEHRTTFLRWDKTSVFSQSNVNYGRVSSSQVDIELMQLAASLTPQSGDWWRQVGAVLIAGDSSNILVQTTNKHLPSELTVYIDGDPRDVIEAGTQSELSTVLHAEQAIVSLAARNGIALKGSRLYITVFPCPVCAKLIAASGISALFFASGHASLDGEEVLKSAGVELIYVETPS